MAFGRKNEFSESVQMADDYGRPFGQPPAYSRGNTSGQPWYRRIGKKLCAIVAGILLVIIIIIIIVVVVEKKKNKYPDYSKLNYSLTDMYHGTSFFDEFDYITGYDPSQGFVHYVPSETATALNLTYASSSSAFLRVDTSVNSSSVPNASTGRFSVRINSKKQYGLNSLFIFDVIHTPTGCATWPALWLTDQSNWPLNGEIDVMEAVNVLGSTNNQMTLHTTKDCSMSVKRKQTGKSLATNCLNSTDDNAGCGVDASTSSTTFGTSFNSAGGGVMAMELRSAGIRMWQFSRSSIPADITAATPDPSTWGEATADFPSTDCDIGSHFKNQSIIANIDLCGSWAGTTSVYDETCSAYGTANTATGMTKCMDFVANYNTAFTDAYWEFGMFAVYTGS